MWDRACTDAALLQSKRQLRQTVPNRRGRYRDQPNRETWPQSPAPVAPRFPDNPSPISERSQSPLQDAHPSIALSEVPSQESNLAPRLARKRQRHLCAFMRVPFVSSPIPLQCDLPHAMPAWPVTRLEPGFSTTSQGYAGLRKDNRASRSMSVTRPVEFTIGPSPIWHD